MRLKNSPQQLDRVRSVAPDSDGRQALLPTAILAATFLAYAVTVAFGFVFDDHVLIVTNDSIRAWRYFPSYFTSHIWSFRYPHLLANYYRPLFLTWLRLNEALFGLHPRGWHLTSVLAHVGVTWLIYRLGIRLTNDTWVAAMAGLFFGLHPIHAEAVAYVSSVQEPLSTFFIVAAILAFVRSLEPRLGPDGPAVGGEGESARKRFGTEWHWHNGWLAASLALTAAAVLSKESAMVLPILVSVYAWFYGGAGGRAAAPVEAKSGSVLPAREGGPDDHVPAGLIPQPRRSNGWPQAGLALRVSLPFWVVVLAYLPLRIRSLKGFAHVITPLPLSTEIYTIPSVLLFYLRLLFWPVGLSCYYDLPYVSNPGWKTFFAPALLLVALGVAVAIWYWRNRRSAPADANVIAFMSLWMAVTILPVLNFRFLPEGELAHDRYAYLPSVGFVILLAMALRKLIKSRAQWFLVAGLALSGAMGFATARQCLFWSDDLTLNYRAHEIAPHNVYAITSLAASLAGRGMDGAAMALYQQALVIQPKFWRANVNVAYIDYARGNYPEAARFFTRAGAADPTDGDQFLYLGMSLLRMGRRSEAEAAVRTALTVRPGGAGYHLGLGMVLRSEGELAEARREVEAELALDPQNIQARSLLPEITRQLHAQAGNPASAEPTDASRMHIK